MQQRVLAQSTRVTLEKDAILTEAGSPEERTYLPCTGLVSLQTMTEDAATVEVTDSDKHITAYNCVAGARTENGITKGWTID